MESKFVKVERPTGSCWQHKERPCWIVFYGLVHPPRYEAYTVKPYCSGSWTLKKVPWTFDNMRLSRGEGFRTFEAAASAIEAVQ
jgi:hypothetical protein